MIYESGKNRRDKQKISDEYPGWKIENRTINELNRISFPHITDGFCQRRWNNKKKKTDMIDQQQYTCLQYKEKPPNHILQKKNLLYISEIGTLKHSSIIVKPGSKKWTYIWRTETW